MTPKITDIFDDETEFDWDPDNPEEQYADEDDYDEYWYFYEHPTPDYDNGCLFCNSVACDGEGDFCVTHEMSFDELENLDTEED